MSKKNAPVTPRSISQVDLDTWLDSLAQTQTLIAPREVSGVLLYRQVEKPQRDRPDFTRPLLPVKEVFFPPTESLLYIKKTGAEIHVSETLPEGKAVVFGVRPCDARGARLLDALFIDTAPADPYYARRRENTALIGLACQEHGSILLLHLGRRRTGRPDRHGPDADPRRRRLPGGGHYCKGTQSPGG